MRQKQMDAVVDEWTGLEDHMLKQKVQEIRKNARDADPHHHCSPLLDHLDFTWLQRSFSPVKRPAPHEQQKKRPAENQRIGAKDHQRVQQRNCPGMDIHILKKRVVEL